MVSVGERGAQHLIDMLPGVPLIESPFFDEIAETAFPDPKLRAAAEALNRDGFAVIDFPDPDFDRRAEAIKDDLRPRYDWERWRSTGWASNSSLRLQDAWTFNDDVKSLACNPTLLDMLSKLYGRRVWPFQTLNFPTGTQQSAHSDSVHFSSLPERFMCGVWVALEDIPPGAGPLVYYPGSHKWPVAYNEYFGIRVKGQPRRPHQDAFEPYWAAMVEKHGIEPMYFRARKGQALIWAANLLHGGSKQTDPEATRWSQVTHYYCDDCMYLTPFHSDIPAGNLMLREPTDISTGQVVENRYLGLSLDAFSPSGKAEIGKDTRGEFERVVLDTLPADYHRGAYLHLNKDIAAAGIDPDEHYRKFGFGEGRSYRLADLPFGTDVETLPTYVPARKRKAEGLLRRILGSQA